MNGQDANEVVWRVQDSGYGDSFAKEFRGEVLIVQPKEAAARGIAQKVLTFVSFADGPRDVQERPLNPILCLRLRSAGWMAGGASKCRERENGGQKESCNNQRKETSRLRTLIFQPCTSKRVILAGVRSKAIEQPKDGDCKSLTLRSSPDRVRCLPEENSAKKWKKYSEEKNTAEKNYCD